MMASSIGMAQQKIAGLNIWLLLPERLNGSKLWRRKTISSYKNKEAMRMKNKQQEANDWVTSPLSLRH